MRFISKTPLDKNENNFNLIRLLLALFVIFSHSYSFLGLAEPAVFGRTLGNFSVHAFFVLSGYLITASWLNPTNSARVYFLNRVLRIAPGLIVALAFCHFVGSYFDSFRGNPIPYIVNGPVWTLSWEIACYLLVMLLGFFHVLDKNTFPAVIVCTLFLYLLNYGVDNQFYMVVVPFFIFFMIGSFVFIMSSQLSTYSMIIPAVFLLLVCGNAQLLNCSIDFIRSEVLFLYGFSIDNGFIRQFMYMLTLPFVLLFVGLHVVIRFKIKNDISYGVYIYGWPVAQIICFYSIEYGFSLTPTVLSVLTIIMVVPIAYLSWLLVEAPSLKLKNLRVVQLIFYSK